MSLKDKLTRAALNAGTEAAARERARCLYVLDKLLDTMRKGLDQKLMNAGEKHLAEVRMQIAERLVTHARRGITMGLRPPGPVHKMVPDRLDDYQLLLDQLRDAQAVLELLGFREQTTEEIREQLRVWDEQEDRIMELEAKIEELEA